MCQYQNFVEQSGKQNIHTLLLIWIRTFLWRHISKKLAAQPGTVVKWLPLPAYHIPWFANVVKRSLVLLIRFIPRRVTSDILLIRQIWIIRELPIHPPAIHQPHRYLHSRPFLGKHNSLYFLCLAPVYCINLLHLFVLVPKPDLARKLNWLPQLMIIRRLNLRGPQRLHAKTPTLL